MTKFWTDTRYRVGGTDHNTVEIREDGDGFFCVELVSLGDGKDETNFIFPAMCPEQALLVAENMIKLANELIVMRDSKS